MCSVITGVLALAFCVKAVTEERYVKAIGWAVLVCVCAAGLGII